MTLSLSIAHAAVAALALCTSLGAHAAFRCDSNGSVTYTDSPCPSGKVVPETDLRQPATVQSEQHAAQLRANADKKQLGAIEATRLKDERAQQKELAHARTMASTHRKKCDALALQARWAHEDAARATSRKSEKTQRRSHRLEQKYALDCQV